MNGYLNKPKATELAFIGHNWYRTEDIGYFDENENLVVEGRIIDIAFHKEKWVNYKFHIKIIRSLKGVSPGLWSIQNPK